MPKIRENSDYNLNTKQKLDLISLIQQSSHDIGRILDTERSSSFEVRELLNTNRLTQDVMSSLLQKNDSKVKTEQIIRVREIQEDLKTELEKLSTKGSLSRALTSFRLRSRLEKSNSQLHNELRLIWQRLLDMEPVKVRDSAALSLKSKEAEKFWSHAIGLENALIDWESFINALSKYLERPITEEQNSILRHVLDNANTGLISAFRFAEYMCGFGPITTCIDYTQKVLSEKWFFGFLSGEEAKKLLQNTPDGTFLVRFSQSSPGNFAVCFSYEGYVSSVLIKSCMPEGLKIEEEGEGSSVIIQTFRDLYGVFEHYEDFLIIPLESPLSRDWFYGDITKDEAEDLLQNKCSGTFLIRFSPDQDGYIASYMAEDRKVQHMHIQTLPSGSFQYGGVSYATINEYISQHKDILKYNFDIEDVPNLKVNKWHDSVSRTPIVDFSGPENSSEGEERLAGFACGAATLTYPRTVKACRPICDRFSFNEFENKWVLACIADGCGLGEKSREAAEKATAAFLSFMSRRIYQITDLKSAGNFLQRAFSEAHARIIKGKSNLWDAGTTTLLGGVLLQLDESEIAVGTSPYAFICASVGDCQAYIWRPRTNQLEPIAVQARDSLNQSDPGGRLGPTVQPHGGPDFRNMRLSWCIPDIDDIIFMVTDGVYDNMDAINLGHDPADFQLPGTEWGQVPEEQCFKTLNDFQLKKFSEVISGSQSPAELSQKLLAHCTKVNDSSRTWMENNTGKLPKDYKKFPGKMDHTTCLAFQVKL